MITLTGFIGDTLKAGETRVIDSYCQDDLTNATKIVYSIKNKPILDLFYCFLIKFIL